MILPHHILADIIEESYSIPVVRDSINSIPSGRNALYIFISHGQTLLAKLAVHVRDGSKIKHEAEILDWLCRSDNAPVPLILNSVKGNPWIIPDGHPTVLLVREALTGPCCEETPRGYALAGTALAQLHQHFDSMHSLHSSIPLVPTIQPLKDLHDASLELSSWMEEIKGSQRFVQIIDFLHERFFQTQDIWDEIKLGHGDAHIFNLVQTARSQACWFDFEDVYLGPRAYDLGTMVWSTLRHKYSQPLWESALRAYSLNTSISKNILGCIPLFVALRQIWWLCFHSKHWGSYTMHNDPHVFFQEGLAIIEDICRDACGM